jgi:hypothetical protein
LSRRFFLPSSSTQRTAASPKPKRIYGLLVALLVLQLFTIGLLVKRTGGLQTEGSDSLSVAQTVSKVQSFMKPTAANVVQKSDSDSVSSSGAVDASASMASPTRVQILNGCGIRGFAKKIVPILRERGFDVREAGNAPHFRYDHTLVLSRTGQLARALALADSFGIDHSQVRTELDPRLVDIDVTLIVGRDYGSLQLDLPR